MSFKQGSAFFISELLRAGISPYTREAAALAAEVCRQVFNANTPLAPTPDDILLHPDGLLTISTAGSASAEARMAALASLLETLLPPLGSTEPDYAVRASLRLLAPRARAMRGLTPISGPEGLAAELSEYATPEPTGILRELWARGDRALHQYLPPPRSHERLTAAAVRASVKPTDPAGLLNLRPSADAVATGNPIESPPAAIHRPRRRAFWMPVTAAALFTVGFAGGDWLGERSYKWTSGSGAKTDAHHSTMPSSGRTAPPHPSAHPAFTEDGNERGPIMRVARPMDSSSP